jgi:hypothetical protein
MSADIDKLLDEFKGAWIEKFEEIEAMQFKLDAQAEELAALRSFSAAVILAGKKGVAIGENVNWISLFAKTSKLIDADGNPTPLLTGKSE